jgi:hypothetical protein
VRPWVLEKCELDAANGYYYCCHCAICNFNGMAAAFAEREAPSFYIESKSNKRARERVL